MTTKFLVRLAQSQADYEQAHSLLSEARAKYGVKPETHGLWLIKQHAMPSTNTIVALEENKVVAAITLFGESAFRLPIEETIDLAGFRQNLQGRIAEISMPATSEEHPEALELLLALYHFTICFGSTYCHYDAFVTAVPEAFGEQHYRLLNFAPLLSEAKTLGVKAYVRSASDGVDFRPELTASKYFQFVYPEKKFYLVAHQSMDANVMNYLFNFRTRLFEKLNDLEVRALKNFYDFGEFAKILPSKGRITGSRETPKFKRYPMNCEGHLLDNKGEKHDLQVLDVCREGLKIRIDQYLDTKAVLALTLQIGVQKQTEIIASVVWFDDATGIGGLKIKSFDKNWQKLVAYLEGESSTAA